MSRTIKRKNQEWRRFYKDAPEFEFYCKHKKGRFSPPHWYCRLMDRPTKRHNERETRKVLVLFDYDPLVVPFKRNAGWNWW